MRLELDNLRFYQFHEVDSWSPSVVARMVLVNKIGELYNTDNSFRKLLPAELRKRPPLVLSGSSMQLERFPGIYVHIGSYGERQYLSPSYRIGKEFGPEISSVLMADLRADFVTIAESLVQRDHLVSSLLLALKSFLPGYYVVEAQGFNYVVVIGPFSGEVNLALEETVGVYSVFSATVSVSLTVVGGTIEHGFDMLFKVLYGASG